MNRNHWKCLLFALFTIGSLCQTTIVRAQDKSQARPEKEIYNTEKKTAGFLTPQQSLAALALPEGFHATLFAAEPQVQQPIAATTDGKGRLWVCENYTYSESRVNFDLSLSDRILIFEDLDQDGKADTRKIFWDKGKRLTSIAIGFDGVFAACAPELLFIPDRNHDDVPDGPAEVLLDGWNDDAVRHNIVNGLMWGPDGWLYGRHGIMATSFVGQPGATASQRTPINCGIWRYHPIHKKFEVVAHGTTNPWGMDFNNEGDLFMINTVIGHLWHVIPGARYERMYGSHFNPYTYRNIQQTADHFHWNKSGGENWNDTKKIGVTDATDRLGGGHAHCGLLFYGDDVWPKQYRNTLFTCNLHGLRINNDRLERRGNGYVGRHNPDFARTTDTWFRGIEMVRSHDQGFYLLDWQDTGECHENDGVHRTSGRIFKVIYGKQHQACDNLTGMSLEGLKQRLTKDRWHFQQAKIEMRTRMARSRESSVNSIRSLTKGTGSSPSLRMLRETLASDYGDEVVYPTTLAEDVKSWPQSGKLGGEQDRYLRERIRVAANAHVLTGKPVANSDLLIDFASRASPRTRLALASLLHSLPAATRLNLAKELLSIGQDKDDRAQPLIIWYALEPLVSQYPQKAAKLALDSKMPLVTELIARRLTEEIQDSRVAPHIVAMIQAATQGVHREKLGDLLAGMAQSLKGRKRVKEPEGWSTVFQSVELTDAQRESLQAIQVVFGDGQTMDAIIKTARNKKADPRMRGQAFLTLAENGMDGLLELLNQHFGDRDVRRYVIEAYAFCDDPSIGTRIINQYKRLKPAGKVAAINTLSKRASWASQLLDAIKSDRIPKDHLTAWHARQISNMDDAALSAKIEKVWGSIRQTPTERRQEMDELRELIEGVKPTEELRAEGKLIFAKSCANCHVLFGEGGKIGPDLTGSNRKDMGYLLENILDPSSSVADGFRTSIIGLADGRSITGVILKETSSTITVQSAEKLIVLELVEVEKIKQTKSSLMPEGLLNGFSDRQKKALMIYLMN